ncbi:hypothetical protein LXL04_016279 [Taraxacum kok-saghyz]
MKCRRHCVASSTASLMIPCRRQYIVVAKGVVAKDNVAANMYVATYVVAKGNVGTSGGVGKVKEKEKVARAASRGCPLLRDRPRHTT